MLLTASIGREKVGVVAKPPVATLVLVIGEPPRMSGLATKPGILSDGLGGAIRTPLMQGSKDLGAK